MVFFYLCQLIILFIILTILVCQNYSGFCSCAQTLFTVSSSGCYSVLSSDIAHSPHLAQRDALADTGCPRMLSTRSPPTISTEPHCFAFLLFPHSPSPPSPFSFLQFQAPVPQSVPSPVCNPPPANLPSLPSFPLFSLWLFVASSRPILFISDHYSITQFLHLSLAFVSFCFAMID